MRWLKWIGKWIIRVVVAFYLFIITIDWITEGETIFTNRERIVTRLEKEAFPLIEKYHFSAIGERDFVCYPANPPNGFSTNNNHCTDISTFPQNKQKILRKINKEVNNVTLKNAWWEKNFIEAKIEFDKYNHIKNAEFYFKCRYCYQLYVYHKIPFPITNIKIAKENGYINPHWHLEDRS